MYQGFYNLTSGMLTQSRNLNVIGNNMVNVQTAGYKRDKMVSTTFEEEMLYRTGRYNKNNLEALGVTSKIRTAQRTYVNYEQGGYDQTGGIFDFALDGAGFFCIEMADGIRYTRNGSFYVDEEGYLMLNGLGRVQSTDGQAIQIDTEDITVDSAGNIVGKYEDGSTRNLGQLRVVDFEDYDQLHKEDYGVISTGEAPREVNGETPVMWQMLERSNVDMVEEMTSLMTAQRALQSAAQVLKMYDQVMSKSATDVGRL